ncbi:hypothetical protein TNCV_4458941 [Trichonephila clavipes]|nr:hypothetical protein TNCV_4458941 [Trichonephila clavipes]
MSHSQRGNRCTSNCSMLTFPEKTLQAKLYYQNVHPLRFYSLKKGVKDLLRTSFGEDRMLSRHFRHDWPFRSPDLNPCDYLCEVTRSRMSTAIVQVH